MAISKGGFQLTGLIVDVDRQATKPGPPATVGGFTCVGSSDSKQAAREVFKLQAACAATSCSVAVAPAIA